MQAQPHCLLEVILDVSDAEDASTGENYRSIVDEGQCYCWLHQIDDQLVVDLCVLIIFFDELDNPVSLSLLTEQPNQSKDIGSSKTSAFQRISIKGSLRVLHLLPFEAIHTQTNFIVVDSWA